MTRLVGKLIALYALWCAARGPRVGERDAWFELERLMLELNAAKQRRRAVIYGIGAQDAHVRQVGLLG